MEQMMQSYSVSENQKVLKNSVSVKTSKEVDQIANRLVEKLNNPDRREYYCKVAWKLSESQIWNNLEQALKGRSPQRYFTFLCQRDMN